MKSIYALTLTLTALTGLPAHAAKLNCDTGRGRFQLAINEEALSFRGKTYYNTGARDLSRNQDQIYEAADGTTAKTTASLVYGRQGGLKLPNGVRVPCRATGARARAARPAKEPRYQGGGDYRIYDSYWSCTTDALNMLLGCYPIH